MIYFIRHGQSTANAGGVTMPHAEIPLSDIGRRQASLLAESFGRQADPADELDLRTCHGDGPTARPFSAKTGCPITRHPLLHEFSALDAALLGGMTTERRPIADAFWDKADPNLRHGPGSETFREFEGRVTAFEGELAHLPDNTVLFGHGIWFGLLCWKLLGFSADDSVGMQAFRRFQPGLPLPNCAVYALEQAASGRWRVEARMKTLHELR